MSNLYDLIKDAGDASSSPAVLYDGRAISYAEILDEAVTAAAALNAMHAAPGDRVIVFSPNVPEYLSIYLGCAYAGVIFCPVNTSFRTRELAYVCANARADVAIVHAAVAAEFQDLIRGVPGAPQRIAVLADGASFGSPLPSLASLAADGTATRASAADESDPLFVTYTSGTTANPKPVLHSHRSAIWNAIRYAEVFHVGRGDRGVVALPLAWTYGLSSTSTVLLAAGSTVVLLPRFHPEHVLAAIESTEATAFFGTMTMYQKMLDVLGRKSYDVSSLRVCLTGAEPCPDSAVLAYETRTGNRLIQAYALTEASPVTAVDIRDAAAPRGTAGKVVPDAAIRLVDTRGQEVAVGEIGEAEVMCPGQMTCYYGEPELTRDKTTADGWVRTGDLLRRDPAGYHFVVGRASDMIIRSGANVAPAEIEAALSAHPAVSAAAVVGAPDAASGEKIVAFVVLAGDGAAVTSEALRLHLEAQLAPYKIPEQVRIIAQLPANSSGKVDRLTLKKLAREDAAAATTG